MRHTTLTLGLYLVFLGLAPTSPAQTVLYSWSGSAAGQLLGSAVALAGDIDGDTRPDVVVGSPGAPMGLNTGRVDVYSGATGAAIFSFVGGTSGDRFGAAVDGVGDVDGDGRADFIIGAPEEDAAGVDAGAVRVYSGATGLIIWTLTGDSAGDHFGSSVSGVGDWNGDLREEFAVGAYGDDFNGFNSGSVYIYSGLTGMTITIHRGDGIGDSFGFAIDRAGDVNNDATPDLVVGAPFDDNTGPNAGIARVFSGANGSVLFTAAGNPGEGFGHSVAGAGDVNADGFADIIVGAPFASGGSFLSGRAEIRLAPLGTPTAGFTFSGANALEYVGASVGSVGDLDGDGRSEFFIGSATDSTAPELGSLRVRSGQNGSILYTFQGLSAGESFGSAAAFVQDLNADGRPELAIGAPFADPNGTSSGQVRAITLEVLAATTVLGMGCSSTPTLPSLGTSLPRIGQNLTVAVFAGTGNVPAMIFASPLPMSNTVLGFGCTAYVDLFNMLLVASPMTNAAGIATISVPLPNAPNYVGTMFVVQAAIVVPAAPLGFHFTNGRGLLLGY